LKTSDLIDLNRIGLGCILFGGGDAYGNSRTCDREDQQLPDSLVQEMIDFIDSITHNHQAKIANHSLEGDCSEAWTRWFQATDGLEITPETTPIAPTSEYQQHLLSKYREQGLDL
jgi:hypothetical protein